VQSVQGTGPRWATMGAWRWQAGMRGMHAGPPHVSAQRQEAHPQRPHVPLERRCDGQEGDQVEGDMQQARVEDVRSGQAPHCVPSRQQQQQQQQQRAAVSGPAAGWFVHCTRGRAARRSLRQSRHGSAAARGHAHSRRRCQLPPPSPGKHLPSPLSTLLRARQTSWRSSQPARRQAR
jgi:hypothetical protein